MRKAPLPLREDYGWHSQIQKLINADAERARKQAASPYPSSWDAPIFGGTFDRRRLKILNALFTCLTRPGMKPQLRGKEGRELSVTVGGTHVSFALDSINATKQLERERQGYGFMARGDKDKMRLTVSRWWKSEALLPSWQDEPRAPLERRLREIAAALIVFAEQTLRDAALSSHTYRIQRKAELEEARRKREAEEERRRREHQAKLEQARVDHLLGQARALEQAQQIRAYVRASRHAAPKPVRLATFRHGRSGLSSRPTVSTPSPRTYGRTAPPNKRRPREVSIYEGKVTSRNLGEPLNNRPFTPLLESTSCGHRPVRRANLQFHSPSRTRRTA